MSGALNFYMKDVYGNGSGYMDSRTQTVPEEGDQLALVDDQDTAKKNPVRHDPKASRNIIIGIIAIMVIVILFSLG